MGDEGLEPSAKDTGKAGIHRRDDANNDASSAADELLAAMARLPESELAALLDRLSALRKH